MAELKKFIVKGELNMRNGTVPFSKEVQAESENSVKNKVKSLFGSNYRLKRSSVVISSVEEVQ